MTDEQPQQGGTYRRRPDGGLEPRTDEPTDAPEPTPEPDQDDED